MTGQKPAALVVDGSNLAWNGRPPRSAGGRPSFLALQAAIRSLQFKNPDRDIHVVVDAALRHDVTAEERPLVEQAIADGTVVQPPAGTEGRGDALIISIADEIGGVIVSNDNFAPFQKANPWLLENNRVLGQLTPKGSGSSTRALPTPPCRRGGATDRGPGPAPWRAYCVARCSVVSGGVCQMPSAVYHRRRHDLAG